LVFFSGFFGSVTAWFCVLRVLNCLFSSLCDAVMLRDYYGATSTERSAGATQEEVREEQGAGSVGTDSKEKRANGQDWVKEAQGNGGEESVQEDNDANCNDEELLVVIGILVRLLCAFGLVTVLLYHSSRFGCWYNCALALPVCLSQRSSRLYGPKLIC
jgi:hypothetical protein